MTFDDVVAAQARIAGHVETTPCLHSQTLSQITGAEVYLKFENLQFTSSFKERGALNKLTLLSQQQRDKGVIAVSA
ncbi:MAG TPA: pyridoxal-phosphate dependent enzyme, partial [Burkholderiaceae bacterium]|nr:pyridoxal-phosphate dependent enzyme [Burkholderiaceae bacterium]